MNCDPRLLNRACRAGRICNYIIGVPFRPEGAGDKASAVPPKASVVEVDVPAGVTIGSVILEERTHGGAGEHGRNPGSGGQLRSGE